MKNILLCPPTYYDIEYEINPWMRMENKINKEKVEKEYEELKSVYKKLGAKVYELKPKFGLPDMVYTTNTGHAENGLFIKSNFRYPQRRAEADIAQAFFEKELKYKTVELPQNIYFEGHGDLLVADGYYFCGYGKRTSYEAIRHLEETLEKPVFALETVDSYFYHLDMCLAVLPGNIVLINPHSFKPQGLAKIRTVAKEVIEVSEADNKFMACNCVVIGNTVVVAKGVSEEYKKTLAKHHLEVHEVEMDEYIKGGGSVFCITFQF